MKLRLIMRVGQEDSDGRCVNYRYLTRIVELPNFKESYYKPEIIGGEWLDPAQQQENQTQHKLN